MKKKESYKEIMRKSIVYGENIEIEVVNYMKFN